ncbi:ABC transporter permease [Scleromatobacter humisilvae]|uniref:ABC transporter permease n=1 Tax=Scleromatobacter humisilvae TaxID=2897159 RepID=A0A9X2C3T0_9BURK|nr:ABC transporter permease [Scleromatobacter humisilvae]MCK9688729.1 ABC transporter permease [Scleromatobacter humisilvae]
MSGTDTPDFAPTLIPVLAEPLPARRADGVWRSAWRRFRRDGVGVVSLAIVVAYALLIACTGSGLVARHWQDEVGVPDARPTFLGPGVPEQPVVALPATAASSARVDIADVDPLAPRYREWDARAAKDHAQARPLAATLPFGGDRLGRDVLAKALKGTQISVSVGVLAAIVATLIGASLGAIAGFFGGRVGDLVEWVYNVLTAVPEILLFFAFAAVFGRGISTLVLIMGLTGWTGQYRQVRAEFIKHSRREYVLAAEAIGAGAGARMFRHILPNVSHVILARMSLLVVNFIKAEVILSYLGLGVRTDQVSWGTMLAESQSELILGHWWQLAAATIAMAVFVTAFSLMADAWRDALDPRLRGMR